MKNKSIWIMGVVVIVVIALAAVVAVIVLNNKKTAAPDTNSQAGTSAKQTYSSPKACDVLTLETAQQVAPGATASDIPAADANSDSIVVSNCNYYDAANKVSVGLLVRGAKDEVGAKSNKAQFDALPAGAQPVSGYGDKAYWDANFGQLNILKGDNWYILSSGPALPSSRTLDTAKQLADAIVSKL